MTAVRGFLGMCALSVVALSPPDALRSARPAARQEAIPGWRLGGSAAQNYEVTLDSSAVAEGRASARLRSVAGRSGGFGTLMQQVRADSLRGRLRLHAMARAADNGHAAVWVRVDGASQVLDYISVPVAVSDSAWIPVEVVLDVPANALGVACGVMLTGSGTVWLDAVSLEAVPSGVPVTSHRFERAPPRPASRRPAAYDAAQASLRNGGFEL